jgi:hypothetical protein
VSESGTGKLPGWKQNQVRERLEETTALYLAGHGTSTIEQRLALRWGVGRRQVRKYVRRAKYQIAHESKRANGPDGQRHLRDEMRAFLRRLLATAVDADDTSAALKVAERLCRLDALDKPTTERVEVTHDIGAHTDDDVLGRVLETELALVRKRAAA